jgi:putative membrane protein
MSQIALFQNFALYLAVTIPLVIVGFIAFLLATLYKEVELIRQGANTDDPAKKNAATAAAYDLSGKMLGLMLVVASAIFHSVSVVDLLIWGSVGIVFQIIMFYLFNLLAPFSVVKEIPKGNVPVAIFASRLSVGVGLVMAALISY